MKDFDLEKEIGVAVDEALKSRGVANILLAGKTGVGKSTLLNSVFQGDFATTGQGKPVTSKTRKITKPGIPLSIYDTRGLEVKDYKETLDELENLVDSQNSLKDHHEHIHVCWLCISEGTRRIEQAEIDLAKMMAKKMPVIIVITKSQSDQGFRSKCSEIIPEAVNYVRVNSLSTTLDTGHVIPASGLDHLVTLTMEAIPEGQRRAFSAAQKIKIEDKVVNAHKVVAASASTAGATAAVPIPFSDFVAIAPIQIGMLAGISSCFGLNVDRAFLSTLVSGTFTSVAGSFAGRAIAGALLKFFPGVGSTGGAAISASVALTLTTLFGEAYIATLYMLLKDDPEKKLTADEITEAFKEKLSKEKNAEGAIHT
ncbi:GTPase [Halomonas sp. RT37]|uniref:GTP-binding DUF697 domain-containing protein n=1 Tax=Halomonas sp. RT37 TaxID=2950872 RepID=A0AAU7KEZ4_9GAMM